MQVHSNGMQYNCLKVLHFIMSLYETFLLFLILFKNFNFIKFQFKKIAPLIENSGDYTGLMVYCSHSTVS